MVNLEEIKTRFEEFWEIAEWSFQQKKYNAAVTLYYKALVQLCDYLLLKSTGSVGANHTDRFKKLQQQHPKLYAISSDLFAYYRDSYDTPISENVAQQVKTYVSTAKTMVFGQEKN